MGKASAEQELQAAGDGTALCARVLLGAGSCDCNTSCSRDSWFVGYFDAQQKILLLCIRSQNIGACNLLTILRHRVEFLQA